MISSGRLFFCLSQCVLLLLTNADDGQPVRGVPGIDYPDYQSIPHTSFRCSQQEHIPGLYADPETGCQMFHHCYEHRHESFLCPPGTIFNEAILACDYWYSADCSADTPHYKVKSQHKASNIDPKIELIPIKNPLINIFNKLASLYEVREPLSIDSDYAFKEGNFFSDEDNTDKHTSASEKYQEYDNGILKVSSIHDRRDGVITETYNDHGNSPYGNKNGEHSIIFDDFESSGEHEDSEEEFSPLNDTEKSINFEKQYFAYDEFKDFEHDEKHHQINEEHLTNFSDILDKKESSSKDLKSDDEFVKRQSKSIENRNGRKHRRRKPIYTVIEHEANVKEFTTTEMPKYETDINLKKPTDSPTYSQESVTTSNHVPVLSTSKTKRRKPVLIELGDSLEYNVDNAQISSIRYGNPQTNIPEFSMDAEEISVKLFLSDTKRKPIDRLTQNQFIETNGNAKLRALNNIASHESNIYHTSTLSSLDNIEHFEDISMNLKQIYPKRKRKKNTIRIIDSEDNHDVYIEHEELKDDTTFTIKFEDDFTTQSTNTNFEDFDKFAETQFDFHDVEKAYEIADDNPELVRQLEDNHGVYVKNKELKDATTFTPTYEDEFTTQSASTNLEDFDKFAEPNFLYRNFEYADEIEDGHSKLVKQAQHNHDVYIDKEDMTDVTTLTSLLENEFTTQSATTNFEDFDKKNYLNFDYHNVEIAHEIENGYSDLVYEQYEDSFSNITPYPHIEMMDESEDTHFIKMNTGATLNEEEYEDKKYLQYINDFAKDKKLEDFKIKNHKARVDYSFVTTEFSIPEISTLVSSKIPHSEGETNRFYFNPNNIMESTIEDLDTSESWSTLVSETSNEIDDVTNVNEKDKLNVDLIKNIHTEASIHVEENYSSKDIFKEQYDSHFTVPDVGSMETEDFSQKENESIIGTILHKLEFDRNIHQSDEPKVTGILGKMELESVENKSDEINGTSNFDDSEIDYEDLTNILDEFEHDQNVAQNDRSPDQEHAFRPKHDSDDKAKLEDSSKTIAGKTITNIETNALNKALTQKNPGSIKPNMKDKPMRIPRMFIPPYTRDFNLERFNKNFNFERFSSQNFASVPYSMLQLKQKSMNKLLGSSMDSYGTKSIEDYYSTRTGDLLESPKISKLISIGKNLLNAKRAKLRILRRYVNY